MKAGKQGKMEFETLANDFSSSSYSTTTEEESTASDESDSSREEVMSLILTEPNKVDPPERFVAKGIQKEKPQGFLIRPTRSHHKSLRFPLELVAFSRAGEQYYKVLYKFAPNSGSKGFGDPPFHILEQGKGSRFLNKDIWNDVFPIYIGDDQTDEDAFKVVARRKHGLPILISSVVKDTNASYSLRNPSEKQEVADLKFQHPQGGVSVPKQLVVDVDSFSISEEVARENLRFPLVVKPLWVDGTAKSDALSLAFNEAGLSNLTTPLVLQEFVYHGKYLRPSLGNIVLDMFWPLVCHCLTFGSQSPASSLSSLRPHFTLIGGR
ncbi:hypothetical protein L7F22_010666 [Adiantum nelumboides]|nr:hypothetical protein [Adiantum nelumboides]